MFFDALNLLDRCITDDWLVRRYHLCRPLGSAFGERNQLYKLFGYRLPTRLRHIKSRRRIVPGDAFLPAGLDTSSHRVGMGHSLVKGRDPGYDMDVLKGTDTATSGSPDWLGTKEYDTNRKASILL